MPMETDSLDALEPCVDGLCLLSAIEPDTAGAFNASRAWGTHCCRCSDCRPVFMVIMGRIASEAERRRQGTLMATMSTGPDWFEIDRWGTSCILIETQIWE